MPAQYFLPCRCGTKHTVDASQAGLEIACSCGEQISVPTLRGLLQLEAVGGPVKPSEPEWGPRQGLAFVGLSIATIALVAIAVLLIRAPKFPEYPPLDRQAMAKEVEAMDFSQTLAVFDQMQKGIDQFPELPHVQIYLNERATWSRYLTGAGIAAGVGLTLTLASLLVPKKRR